MPKGGKKRTNAEYEKEIADAVKRFKKYPERIKSANDSDDWIEFLKSVGIYENSIEAGSDFWERVREATLIDTQSIIGGHSRRSMISSLYKVAKNASVYIDTYESGSVYREVYSGYRAVHRDMKTGRFTKKPEF